MINKQNKNREIDKSTSFWKLGFKSTLFIKI